MNARRVLVLAWKSLWLHRLRSFLTVLGIVFGVGSVVAMLAIGEGASQDAQARIRRLGSRNILLTSVKPASSETAGEARQRVLEYGLLESDLLRIRETMPDLDQVVPRRDAPEELRLGSRKLNAILVGTMPSYADVAMLHLVDGRFLEVADLHDRRAVCVIGAEVAERLFRNRDPIGRRVRARDQVYEVVGVLAARGEASAGAGPSPDASVFVPLTTMQARYGEIISDLGSGNMSLERVALHQIIVQARTMEAVPRLATALRRLLERWHPKDDVRMTVPLELLREAARTKQIFTVVLGSIAAISLLVGGIGIMNIMLASVLERTREVGIRRALGARRVHIIVHFLAETVVLSVGGGLIGLLLGIGIPTLVSRFSDMTTVVTPFSLGLAFGISALVGVVFGLYPAVRAADLDPVEALRHE